MKNKIAVCIASGPSLNLGDVSFCKGKAKIYAVKESAFMAPYADVLYAADTDWWDMKGRWDWFQGEKWTLSSEASIKYGLNFIEYDNQIAWSDTQGLISSGGNSGFQALNLAVLQGAETVFLLGYDMGHGGGQKHWWDKDMPRESRNSDYHKWIERFNKAAPLIKAKVINCSPNTALTCFPRMTIQDAFKSICPPE